MDIGIKLIGIIEQIEQLDQKTRDKILLENHLLEGDLHTIKLNLRNWYEYPSEFECQFCGETNEIHN